MPALAEIAEWVTPRATPGKAHSQYRVRDADGGGARQLNNNGPGPSLLLGRTISGQGTDRSPMKGPTCMHTLRHAVPGSQADLRAECADAAELILPAAPKSAETARRFADATLGVWGVPDTGDVVLVISELAANAVSAEPPGGAAEILVRLNLAISYVIVQVGDGNPLVPPRPARRASRARAEAESGRGLPIARALSATLCWYSDGRWKIIWAAVPRSDAPPRRDTWTRWDTWTRRRLGRAA